MNGVMGDLKTWFGAPFSEDMNALHWFYFVGLLLLIGVAWGYVLRIMKSI
jgi:hypothetical protein